MLMDANGIAKSCSFSQENGEMDHWPLQEPIHWRYLPYKPNISPFKDPIKFPLNGSWWRKF